MSRLLDQWDADRAAKVPTWAPGNSSPAEAAAGGSVAGILRWLGDSTEGERNRRLHWSACRMGEHVQVGNIGEAEAVAELERVAYAIGLDAREVRNTIRSGVRQGAAEMRHTPQLNVDTRTGEVITWSSTAGIPAGGTPAAASAATADAPSEPDEDTAAAVRKHLPPLDWRELWDRPDDEEEWIVEPLIPARRLVALYSPPKAGKSLLMLELAAAVATGGAPLLGYPVQQRRVLYVDFENDPKADVKRRLQAMGYRPEQLDDLVYLSFPNLAALDSEQGSLELLAAAQVYGCEVVVVDTVSRAVKGDENENDTWLSFYRHTGLKLKQAGIALVRLDHAGKDVSKGQRGGSAKSGDVDAVWRLEAITEKSVKLVCEANRFPISEKLLMLERVEVKGQLSHRPNADTWKAQKDAKVAKVVALLDELGLPNHAGRPAATTLLHDHGKTAPRELTAALKVRKARGPEPLIEP